MSERIWGVVTHKKALYKSTFPPSFIMQEMQLLLTDHAQIRDHAYVNLWEMFFCLHSASYVTWWRDVQKWPNSNSLCLRTCFSMIRSVMKATQQCAICTAEELDQRQWLQQSAARHGLVAVCWCCPKRPQFVWSRQACGLCLQLALPGSHQTSTRKVEPKYWCTQHIWVFLHGSQC